MKNSFNSQSFIVCKRLSFIHKKHCVGSKINTPLTVNNRLPSPRHKINKHNVSDVGQMRRNAEKCDRICIDVRRYANFRTCGIISSYAILKTQLYAEKYVICRFSQNMRSHMQSHVRIYPASLTGNALVLQGLHTYF